MRRVSGGRFAGCTSWVSVVRRKVREVTGTLPAELVGPTLWPLCPRFDGGVQPCSCWCVEQQETWLADGNEWPGGARQELADLLELVGRHPCREPFGGRRFDRGCPSYFASTAKSANRSGGRPNVASMGLIAGVFMVPDQLNSRDTGT